MNEPGHQAAWLEKPDGERVAVAGGLFLGRTPDNALRLADERVSRRHALIHAQGADGCWLADLGGRNGTRVNGRRVSQPFRLRDGDRIQIGPFTFVFRQAHAAAAPAPNQMTTQQTLVELRTQPCWLLVLDVVRSTDLVRTLPAEQLAVLMGRWFLACQPLIETHRGLINKFLGDGLLAYWPVTNEDARVLARLIGALRQMQAAAEPAFRCVWHRGPVLLGGAASLGEESLPGPEVHFVFRMEKLAGQLGFGTLFSAPAAQALVEALPLNPVGEHGLSGFEGRHAFFSS